MAYENVLSNYKYIVLILCFTIGFINSVNCIEPITLGVAAGVGALGFNFFKGQTYCRVYECCDDRSIPADMNRK